MAQVTKSPFTSLGLGDLKNQAPVSQQGMAGVGFSNGDARYVNFKNPALLVKNAVYTFSVGLVGERRKVASGSGNTTGSSANLDYLAISFPISKKVINETVDGKPLVRNVQVWTSAITLNPFNNVSYRHSYQGNVLGADEGVTLDVTEEGSGGFNQLSWLNGIRITDWLSLGVKADYYFSSMTKSYTNRVQGGGISLSYNPAIFQRDAASDFSFSGSLALSKELNKDIFVNLGLVHELKTDLNVKRFRTLERRFYTGTVLASDTLISNQRGTVKLPESLGLGLSLSKKYKWSVGLDLKQKKWSGFVDYDGGKGILKNSMEIALGGEITPDILSVDNYLKRVTYRLGMSLERLPYVIDGNQVDDFGINFGYSLPVGHLSSLDMAFRIGQRGNTDEQLIKENYFRAHIGLTFNDKFFGRQRKYD